VFGTGLGLAISTRPVELMYFCTIGSAEEE
jgi:hypothetical protein